MVSMKLGGEGLVVRYDSQNELAAIGCRNGDRLIYDVVQRIYNIIQIKLFKNIIAQIKTQLPHLNGGQW